MNVLLVEPDAFARKLMVQRMEEDVEMLHVAENGEEGLILLGEHVVDVVFTD